MIIARTLCCGTMSSLRIERDHDVLRITIAKPERRNAFDAALIVELTEAFADVGSARAVVLAGDGPSFCAGADVEWQRSSVDLSYDENVADAMRLYRMLETIDACPAPVVARIQGFALGGGSGVVACADVAVARVGRGLRLHRSPPRNHPGRHLAVRAGPHRAGRGSPLLPDRRAVRRRDGAPNRARGRDRRGSRRSGRAGGRQSAGCRAGGRSGREKARFASGPMGRRPPTLRPRCGRAPRARRGSERFWKSERGRFRAATPGACTPGSGRPGSA